MGFAIWPEAWTLTDYIGSLLKDGKRSQHEDFQILFLVFGKDKITEIAKRLLDAKAKPTPSVHPEQ